MCRRSIGLLALALACSSSEDGASPPLTGSAGTRGEAGAGSASGAGGAPDAAPPRTDEGGPRPDELDRPEPTDTPASDTSDAGLLPAAADGTPDAGPACPESGNVRYTLARSMAPTPDEQDAYERITLAMDEALVFYNCYTSLSLELRVTYVPGVATADGNVNGSMRFGSRASMNSITAMHEIGHTAGVGGPRFQPLIQAGVYTGASATRVLRELTEDPSAELRGDTQHFWPYGLNYTSEVSSDEDLIRHCLIVGAMQADFGG
jgi:hypothetical protein